MASSSSAAGAAGGGRGGRGGGPPEVIQVCSACEGDLGTGPHCSHLLCQPCCLLAQINNGTTCSVHEPTDSSAHSSTGSSTSSKRLRENISRHESQTILKTHFKDAQWLNITSPQLVFCPRSLLLLELKNESAGTNLVQRKSDTWLATHSRFKYDAAEVRSLTTQVIRILSRDNAVQDPVDAVELLREPLKRMYAMIHVRSKAGAAGMNTFLERTAEEEEVPQDYASALPAAMAAGRRAWARRADEDAAAGNTDSLADQRGGGRGRGRGGRGRGRAGRGGGGVAQGGSGNQGTTPTPNGGSGGASANTSTNVTG